MVSIKEKMLSTFYLELFYHVIIDFAELSEDIDQY